MAIYRIVLALVVVLLSHGALAQTDSLRIGVLPATLIDDNGYKDVPEIFGAAVNGSLMAQQTEAVQALNLNSARAYFWPLYNSMPVTPWLAQQYGQKNVLTREQSAAAWDTWYKQDFSKTIQHDIQAGIDTNAQMNQLRQYERWGLKSGLVYQIMQPDGASATHIEGVERYFVAYIDAIHSAAPDLPIDFVQFTNEPNYSQWSGQFATTKESVDTWLSVFNTLDKYLRSARPQTRLLGPCLDSGVAHGWTGWKDWTLPFLTTANDIHFFNYHLYDLGASESLAWMEMRQAEGEKLRNVRPRAIITETNLLDSKATDQQRFLWHAQHLFAELHNPDKYAMRHYFLLAYEGSDDMFVKRNGRYEPGDDYWLYWALNRIRGGAVSVSKPTGSLVDAFASRPSNREVALGLLNNGATATDVRLDPGLPSKSSIVSVMFRSAFVREGVPVHQEESPRKVDDGAVSVTLPPHSVAEVVWTLRSDLAPTKVIIDRECYAGTVATDIAGGLRVPIHVEFAPHLNANEYLRLGIYTDDPLSAQQLTMTLNGVPLKIIWSSLPVDVDNGNLRTTWWARIALPSHSVAKDNMLVFGPQDADYRLMFAAIECCSNEEK